MCLSYGTYANTLQLCLKTKEQQVLTLHNAFCLALGLENFSEDYNRAWKQFNCIAEPNRYITDAAFRADCNRISQGFRIHILPLLDSNSIKLAILALRDMVVSDSIIDDETVTYTCLSTGGRISKAKLETIESFEPCDFFAGVFLLAIEIGNNRRGRDTILHIKKAKKAHIERFRNEQQAIKLTTRTNAEPMQEKPDATVIETATNPPPTADHLESLSSSELESSVLSGLALPAETAKHPAASSKAGSKEALTAAVALVLMGQILGLFVIGNSMGLLWIVFSLLLSAISIPLAVASVNRFQRFFSSIVPLFVLGLLALTPVVLNYLTVRESTIILTHLLPNLLGFAIASAFFKLRRYVLQTNSRQKQQYSGISNTMIITSVLSIQVALLVVAFFDQHTFMYQFFNNIYLVAVISWCILHGVLWLSQVTLMNKVGNKIELNVRDTLLFSLLILFFVFCGLQSENEFVFYVFKLGMPAIVILLGLTLLFFRYARKKHRSLTILAWLLSSGAYVYLLWHNGLLVNSAAPFIIACFVIISVVINRTSTDN
ncbi:MAG: hypothetical protein FWC96_00785 [Oscillospiraceae bacterium]|nr:hypothetical protein [Oscillospiraceae bacterium]